MTEKKTKTLEERIHRSIVRNKKGTLSYILDKVTRFRLNRIDDAVQEVIRMAKEGEIIIYDSEEGLKYKLTQEDGKEKTKEA